jgi:hypothetical protein
MPYFDHEHVSFSDAEWRAMQDDPVYFGYACSAGHAIREDDPAVIANGCPVCFELGEYEYAMYCEFGEPDDKAQREWERYAASLRNFPLIACGNCKDQHVGKGAVRRCYAESGRFSG